MSFALTFQIAVHCTNYNIHYPIQIFLFLKKLVRLWSLTVLSDMSDQTFCLASPIQSGFGGLGVACWPLVPKFAGSNLAEAVGFFRAKKSSARLPSEEK